MPLFLVTHKTPAGEHPVFIVDTHFEFYAIMFALEAKHPGKFESVGRIDPAQAHKVPKKMLGRSLNQLEIAALLAKMEGG